MTETQARYEGWLNHLGQSIPSGYEATAYKKIDGKLTFLASFPRDATAHVPMRTVERIADAYEQDSFADMFVNGVVEDGKKCMVSLRSPREMGVTLKLSTTTIGGSMAIREGYVIHVLALNANDVAKIKCGDLTEKIIVGFIEKCL